MILTKRVSLIIGMALLTACSGVSTMEINPGDSYSRTKRVLEASDFNGDCRIQIKSSEISQSGKCNITLSHDNQFRLSILHPFGGTLLQSYIGDDIVQLMDSVNETFIQSLNKAINREKVLGGFNLTLDEIRQIFLGREESQVDALTFQYKNSLPCSAQVRGIQITYKSWSNYRAGVFPKVILIEDLVAGHQLKIAFTHINLTPATGKSYRLLDGYKIQF